MSTIQTNAIVDASGGNTATVNGVTPNTHSVRGRNLIINGAMNVAQRGASVTIANTGAFSSPDHFRIQHNANTTSTVEQVSDVPASSNFKYSLKFTNGAGETRDGGDYARLYTRLEGYDTDHLKLGTSAAKGFTLQFWVKSSLTGTFGVGFAGHDNGSNGVYSASYTISAANTWEYKTITVPAATITAGIWTHTNGTAMSIHWDLGEGPTRSTSVGWNAGGNGGQMGLTNGVKLVETTGATLNLTGVKLEEGAIATEFDHRSYAEELALCQRYYHRSPTGVSYSYLGSGSAISSNSANVIYTLPVEMRSAPTFSASGNFQLNSNATNAVTTFTAGNITPYLVRMMPQGSSGNMTVGYSYDLRNVGDTSAYVQFDAEL
jgi:hypothetical protein